MKEEITKLNQEGVRNLFRWHSPLAPRLPNWKEYGIYSAGTLTLTLFSGILLILLDPHSLPLTKIQVSGIQHASLKQLTTTLQDLSRGKNLLILNFSDTRRRLLATPWVKAANIQLRWPNTLQITLQEHQPLAHWQPDHIPTDSITLDTTLVATDGQLFTVPTVPMELPTIVGPVQQLPEILNHYRTYTSIFQNTGYQITEFRTNARQATTITLNHGLKLLLGRGNLAPRLQRTLKLLKVTQQFTNLPTKTTINLDLRYTNGGVATKNVRFDNFSKVVKSGVENRGDREQL